MKFNIIIDDSLKDGEIILADIREEPIPLKPNENIIETELVENNKDTSKYVFKMKYNLKAVNAARIKRVKK
jgi:hypothetical protein